MRDWISLIVAFSVGFLVGRYWTTVKKVLADAVAVDAISSSERILPS